MSQPTPTPIAIDYPDSDGLPMAESDFQRDPLIYAVEVLKMHFRNRRDVYVSGNLFLYYQEGDAQRRVAPDVFVVFGAPNYDRASYRLWEEPKAPDFVMEIASPSTYRDDQGWKRSLYARLGVREYWQYDPTGDSLVPPLQGFVLSDTRYVPVMEPERMGSVPSASSPVLGLDLRLHRGVLRFYDPVRHAYLLRRPELEDRLRETEDRLHESEQARREAEARLAELEARLHASQPPPPPEQPNRPGR
jgi:Uma2 family endonuclease